MKSGEDGEGQDSVGAIKIVCLFIGFTFNIMPYIQNLYKIKA
jgi:hypothetical protein